MVSEAEEFEFRRRAEQEAARKNERTLIGALGEGASNIIPHLVKGVTQDVPNLVRGVAGVATDQRKREAAAEMLRQGLRNAGETVGGYVQQVRDLSPPEQRGTAPRMNTARAEQMERRTVDRYGVDVTPSRLARVLEGDLGEPNANAYRTFKESIAEHPLTTIAAVAPIARGSVAPVMRTAEAVTPAIRGPAVAVERAVSPVAQRTSEILQAGRLAKEAATEADAATQAARSAAGSYLKENEQLAAALARRKDTKAETLSRARASALEQGAPERPAIGTEAHLSEIGDTIRQPALANEAKINAEMREADRIYRSAMEQISAEQAAKGVGISDVPAAQEILAVSKALVDPSAAGRPAVGFEPTDSAGGRLHRMAIEVFSPRTVKPQKSTDMGLTIDPQRTIKPGLESADDFRRFLGKVLSGEVEGYEAINKMEAKRLYEQVSRAIDEYVSGASAPVQENWRTGKQALEPFERVQAGRTVVGTQKGTDVPVVPAAAIPGRVVAGGRDTLEQTAAVAGAEATEKTLRSMVQNALVEPGTDKPVSAAQAAKLLAPGGKLADAIAAYPALSDEVQQYVSGLRRAEAAGERAEAFGVRAEAAQKAAEDATTRRTRLSAQFRELEAETELGGVLRRSDSLVSQMAKRGDITRAQHEEYLRLSREAKAAQASAKTAAERKASRDRFLKLGAAAVGVSALGTTAGDYLFGGR